MEILTMGQFLNNPSTDSNLTGPARDKIKADLEARYRKLYKERKSGFSITMFRLTRERSLVAWIKVPSESMTKTALNYDILLEFQFPPSTTGLPRSANFSTLDTLPVRVFSNSPSFTYNYAYVCNKNGLLIEWMKRRMSTKALELEPVKRNPNLQFGFEKSIYFALLHFKDESRRKYRFYMNDWSKTAIGDAIPTSIQKTAENSIRRDEQKEKENQAAKRRSLLPLNMFSLTKKKEDPAMTSSTGKARTRKKTTATMSKKNRRANTKRKK